jgi:hypothetical protein
MPEHPLPDCKRITFSHPGCSDVVYLVRLHPRLGFRTREEFDAEITRLVMQGIKSGAEVRIASS